MATEAEISEPVSGKTIGEEDKELICGQFKSSLEEMQKVEDGLNPPGKIVENPTKTEFSEVATNVQNETPNPVVEGNVGISEGKNLLESSTLAKVAIEDTSRASHNCEADEKMIRVEETSESVTQLLKDQIDEAVEDTYGIKERDKTDACVTQASLDNSLENERAEDGEPAKASILPSEENNIEEYVGEKLPYLLITPISVEPNLQKEQIGRGKHEAMEEKEQTYDVLHNNELDKLPVSDEMEGKKLEESPISVFEDQNLNLVPSFQNINKEIEKSEETFNGSLETEIVMETSLQKGETEELKLKIDKGNETQKEEEIPSLDVETGPDKQASIASSVSQKDEIDGTMSGEDPELESGEQVHETIKSITDHNQEALSLTPGMIGESSKKDVVNVTEACRKEVSIDKKCDIDTEPTKQDAEETSFEGVKSKEKEKFSNIEGMEKDPNTINPNEKIGDEKQVGEANPQDNLRGSSASKVTESTEIQNDEEIIKNGEGANDKLDIPSDTSLIKAEPERGGKLDEVLSIALEEKSQETINSSETMKDENLAEDEIQDNDNLEIPSVTKATESTCFQEQDKPQETTKMGLEKDSNNEVEPENKILEIIATAESNIYEAGKDDENPERKLDASIMNDEERLKKECEKMVLSSKAVPIEENKEKDGSPDIEDKDNIEVTEIIEARENSKRETSNDEEVLDQRLLEDEQNKKKLEKSLDVVSEELETVASSEDAEKDTSKKEESIEGLESFEEKREKGRINKNNDAREHEMPKEENLRAVDLSEKIENMEAENPNMEMDLSVTHPLVKEDIQELCEKHEKISNLELEEQIHEENRADPEEEKYIQEVAFELRENMESTISEHEKTTDSPTLGLISETSETKVEEPESICELGSKEKLKEMDASENLEEEMGKQEETSKVGICQTETESEDIEKKITEEDHQVMDYITVSMRNETVDTNCQVEEQEAAPKLNGEDQSWKTNDTSEATENDIINKEVSQEPKIAGACEGATKQILDKEDTVMDLSTESIREKVKESPQVDNIETKKHKGEVCEGLEIVCEKLETSSTGEISNRQIVKENSTIKDHSTEPIGEKTVTESSQENKVCERVETTATGEETERHIFEEYGAVTDLTTVSVDEETVKESSQEDDKEKESFEPEVRDSESVSKRLNFEATDSTEDTEMGTSKNEKDPKEEMMLKNSSERFAVYEEHIKEEDLKKSEYINKMLDAASDTRLQEAEPKEERMVDASYLASEEKSVETIESSCTSIQSLEVKCMKLKETPNFSENTEKEIIIVEKEDADKNEQEIKCEMPVEASDMVTGFDYQGVETTTGTDIAAGKVPLDEKSDENLQEPSTLAPKEQELESIEACEKINDDTPNETKDENPETPFLTSTTGEISFQKEEPGKFEEVSEMGTEENGEGSNEEQQKDDGEMLNNIPEASPVTEPLEEEMIKTEGIKNSVDISNLVSEMSEEKIKEDFEDAEETSLQESEPEGEKFIDASDIGFEEKILGIVETVETSSWDEEIKKVQLDETSNLVIQLPSEGDNADKENLNVEKRDADEIKEETKRSSDTVSESKDLGDEAITETQTTAHQTPLAKKSEEKLQGASASVFEQELGRTTMIEKMKDEILKEDDTIEEKNLGVPFITETPEEMCLQKEEEPREIEQASKEEFENIKKVSLNEEMCLHKEEEPRELEQASKMEFKDTEKESPDEEPKEKEGEKLDEAHKMESKTHVSVAQGSESSDSLLERKNITKLTEDSENSEIETLKDEKTLDSDSQIEEEGQKIETPSTEMCEEDDHIENLEERDIQEKDDHIDNLEENLEEEGKNIEAIDLREKTETPEVEITDYSPITQSSVIETSPEVGGEYDDASNLETEKLERSFESVSEAQTHEILTEIEKIELEKDGCSVKDQDTISVGDDKDSKHLEEARPELEADKDRNETTKSEISKEEEPEELESAGASDTFEKWVTREDRTVKDTYLACVGEETVKEVHQEDKREGKKVEEVAPILEVEDKSQGLEAIEDQGEKMNKANETTKCDIFIEEMSKGLDNASASENIGKQIMEEKGAVKDPHLVSVGEQTCKESHHEDEKEGKKFNGETVKLDPEDQSQDMEVDEDLKDKANEVFVGFENVGASAKTEKQITEEEGAVKDLYLGSFGEKTLKEIHQEKEKDGEKVEVEAAKLDPEDQNHETSCKVDSTENFILNEEVKHSHLVSVEQELQTVFTDKIETVTIKDKGDSNKKLDVSPITNAPKEEVCNEPEEASSSVHNELIHESIKTNEENTESTSEDKSLAKELIEVEKLKNTSLNLASNPSDITEDLHLEDQGVSANNPDDSSVTEASQEISGKGGQMIEDEESQNWVFVKQETAEESLPTGKRGDPIKDEAPVEEILKKEGEKMNNDANIQETTCAKEGGRRTIPEQEEQATAERCIRDGPGELDTTTNLVIKEKSHVKTGLVSEVQIHGNDKIQSTNPENADSINEKLSVLSEIPSSVKKLSPKEGTVPLPEFAEIPQNIERLGKNSDATPEEQAPRKADLTENRETKVPIGDEDIPSVPQDSPVKPLQKDYIKDQKNAEVIESESKEKENKCGGENPMDLAGETTEELKPLDTDKVSLSDIPWRSTNETLHMVAGDINRPTDSEDLQNKNPHSSQVDEEKTDEEEKDEEEEDDEHRKADLGSDAPVMVEASRDVDVKRTHKKSHNILSGVGSKVKHSIAKVKKAITGKSSHPKPVSPK